jgi:hypothetical protein
MDGQTCGQLLAGAPIQLEKKTALQQCQHALSSVSRANHHTQPINGETMTLTTPWKAEKEGELYRYIVDARGVTVCHLLGATSKNHEAIAHGIVRPVNSYSAMREALAAAVARVELANAEGNPIMSAWLSDAKAALALADGRPTSDAS